MTPTSDLDAYRGMNYEIAEAIAPTWEARRVQIEEIAAPVREWMVREAALQENDTVLELAAGTGDTGFEAAATIGKGGRLISTDFSPTMLEGTRRRGTQLGVENVEYRVVDAERIELDSDSVDGVICRFGYMLMADPAAAFAETRRVLRQGGRLVLAVWGPPEQNPFFTAAVVAMVQTGQIEPPDPEGPGLFSLANEKHTKTLLHGAGFEDVRTDEVPVRFEIPSIDEYVAVVADTAGSIALALRGLSPSARHEVEGQAAAILEHFASSNGYEIPGVALCAVAE